MKPKTLKALKQSIKHWEDVVSGKDRSIGASRCALCRLFNPFQNKFLEDTSNCDNECPVKVKTGEDWCHGTPYAELVCLSTNSEEFQEVAKRELEFLKSLLPTE